MSSNQWETVTKTKKQQKLEKKVNERSELKRAPGPKLDEILPAQEYHTIVKGKSNSQNVSPSKSTSSSNKSKSPSKTAKVTSANNVKGQEVKKTPTTKQATKPKSLELALRSLKAEDFTAQLEHLKLLYPGSELLWLKGIANYFNTNLPFDCDPVFSGKPFNYPSNLASKPLTEVTVNFLKSVGEANLEYFYHALLISLTGELAKNLPIVGYKLLLQMIGHNWPHICSNNMAKIAMLRNSYQNRVNVCLTILWAIGQGGYKQLAEGVKVWQNLMLPTLEMKNFSKYISEYMERILTNAGNLTLPVNEFLATYNALRTPSPSLPKEQREILIKSADMFLQKYIASSSKHANLFLTLFRSIESARKNQIELDGCRSCLIRNDDECFIVWKMNYKKQIVPTKLLLEKLCNDKTSPAVNSNSLQKFLKDVSKFNEEMYTEKRKDPNLEELISVVQGVQEKQALQQKKKQSAEQKKCCCTCKFLLGSLFILALIGGVIAYDTEVNGKGVFEKSTIGRVLKSYGALPYVEKAWYTTMGASARGYKWAEKNVPPYAKPAVQLLCDLYKLGRNAACNALTVVCDFVSAKLPVAANFVEQYVPGLPNKIETTSVAVKNIFVDVYGKTLAFFQTQVLVGNLSPENLSKTLNATQNAALEYYHLFHKKVDAYAKLK